MEKIVRFYQSGDKLIFFSNLLAMVFIGASVVSFWLNYQQLPAQIPLFYSQPWGLPQLGSLSQFLLLPVLATLFIVLNIVLSWYLHEAQIFLKRLLGLSAAICAFLLLITSIKIISIFV